jgi:hypothetical protein
MFLSAVSVLVFAQPISEVPEVLIYYPVFFFKILCICPFSTKQRRTNLFLGRKNVGRVFSLYLHPPKFTLMVVAAYKLGLGP